MGEPEFTYVSHFERTSRNCGTCLTSTEFSKRYWWDKSVIFGLTHWL